MNKKILIILLAAVVALGGTVLIVKHVSDLNQQKNEIVNILMQRSEHNNSELDNMLRGEGKFGELYFKIKDDEKFHQRVYEYVEVFLNEHPDMKVYDFVTERLKTLEQEGLVTDGLKQLLDEYKSKIIKQYAESIGQSLESGEYLEVAKGLAWLFRENAMEQSTINIETILDELMKTCKIYAVQPGKGAYYDYVAMRERSNSQKMAQDGYKTSVSKESAYGDFSVMKSSTTTHYEGMEGFYLEDEYNTSSSSTRVYLRGTQVNGTIYPDTFIRAVEHGAEYVICAEQPSDDKKTNMDFVLMLGKDKLFALGSIEEEGYKNDSPGIILEGDFSQYVKKAEKIYNEKYSQDTELKQATDFMNNKQYEEAVNIFQHYTHVSDVSNYIYTMAVRSLRDGNTESGLKYLESLESFSAIHGLDMAYMIENLEKSFDPDIKYRDEYPQVFLRLMMDVVGPMKSSEIKKALSGKQFDYLPHNSMYFDSDNTGYQHRSSGNLEYTWTTSDNKLMLRYKSNGDPTVYQVYPVLEEYYLLAYTPEHSSSVYMTLLKSKKS